MAISSMEGYSGQNGLPILRNDSSCDSMVAMLGPGCSPHVGLQGARGLEDAVALHGQKRAFYATYDGPTVEDGAEEVDEGCEDCSPGGSHLEKKRRLTFDQVRSLERNFEIENKLEPERKMQLAKELGLRPRQVAVWFQNRRARWKTKQLERDFEALAADYERLKADFEVIVREKNQLKAEVQRLSGDTLASEHGDCNNQVVEYAQTPSRDRVPNSRSSPTVDVSLACANYKEEASGCTDGNSSDVLDADSPRTTDSSSPSAISDREQLYQSFPPESSFMAPSGMLPDAKLEDGSSDLHEDHSSNYLLLPLDEQNVLPWWDWP